MINYQNRSKVFLAIIAILLIANIVLLVFFLQKKEPENQGGRPDRRVFIANFLQKDIGFSQQQLLQYDTLSNRHHEEISGLFENVRNNKNLQFKQLVASGFSDSVINIMADQSAASQKIIQINTFNYVKRIRLLCTPEQLPRFDSLFIKVFNRKREGRKKTEK